MISKDLFFKDVDTINVFTDASVKNHGQVTESIAGAVIHLNKGANINVPLLRYTRLIPSTNNEGEIYAIYMGILACLDIKNIFPDRAFTFNLFSDSRICILGLREWYDSWVNNTIQMQTDHLVNSSGQEVKNQQIFLRCFNTIINNNLKINMYHIRGHINLNSKESRKTFAKDFRESNHLRELPSQDLIAELVRINDIVDTSSRALLLPAGKNIQIPTIMGTHKKSDMKEFQGVPIKSEFLFTHDMMKITNEKKRYAHLVELPNKI